MKFFLSIIFILVMSFFVVKHLAVPGFFPIHDDTQISRVYQMRESLKDGMFPVRWVKDLGYGYGYPLFNFYAPLSYYAGGFINNTGVDAILSTKIIIALGIFLSAIFMFLLGRQLWGNLGGVISSVLYIYAPYNAVNIYVRGNVSELWGYAFVPLLFYGLLKIYKSSNIYFIFVSALGFAGIILSHNLTALMSIFFIIPTLIFFLIKNKKALIFSLLGLSLGLLLSSFYFIPALLEMGYTNVFSQIGETSNFKDHFICIQQLWESNWGFGGSAPGCTDGMSFRLGKLHIILPFLTLFLVIRRKIKDSLVNFIFILLLISIILMLPLSKPVWEFIPATSYIQYPWRFLVFASFFASILGGGSILITKFLPKNIFKHAELEYLIVISIVSILLYSKLFVPQTTLPKIPTDYTSESVLTFKISKISDEYLPKNFKKPKTSEISSKFSIQKGAGEVLNISNNTQKITASIRAETDIELFARLAYFPAWRSFMDGKEINYVSTDSGLILDIPRGMHLVELKFIETPIEKASNTLSLAGLLILILGTIYQRKKHESSRT